MDDAEIKYSTVQNWYAGDESGNGGIYNFVTKRGLCAGRNSHISWTQVEAGSAITWKYPGCILKGDNSRGEFYSVALTNNKMQADTGTKMVHIGKNTRSKIISKGISAEHSKNVYRGQVKIMSSPRMLVTIHSVIPCWLEISVAQTLILTSKLRTSLASSSMKRVPVNSMPISYFI